MAVDYRERRLRFWCQKVLPLVYDESLSYYELLCKIMKHLSEAETDVSALEAWLAELDEQAVKQIYSEYPLYAERENGQVILRARSAVQNIVTDVEAADGSPITVGATGGTSQGSLDPNNPDAPTGKTNVSRTITLDINDATEEAKGVMSAEDKTKLNRLYNTTVEAGDNIVVTSTTAANGDTNYVVGVDPNFQPTIQEWSLTGGEWEWNACLSGTFGFGYWRTYTAFWMASVDTPSRTTPVVAQRMAQNGAMVSAYNTESTQPAFAVTFAAYQDYPFAQISTPASIVDGGEYFTTTTPVRIKCQLEGYQVTNRAFRIYLGSQENMTGQNYNQSNNFQPNPYLTEEDPLYPAGVNNHYIPAYYDVTTDSNGYFDVTIPAGVSAKAINSGGLPSAATRCDKLAICAKGDLQDLYSNVSITGIKIAVLAKLN